MTVEDLTLDGIVRFLAQLARSFYNEYLADYFGSAIDVMYANLSGIHTAFAIIMIVSAYAFAYFLRKRAIVRVAEYKKYYRPVNIQESEARKQRIQWEIVLRHMGSENPAEWKLAILEADNMLDAVLEERGIRGETLGEKLKFAETRGVKNLDAAWKAHKVRNMIAHGGAVAHLSAREARAAIDDYEKFFKELGYL